MTRDQIVRAFEDAHWKTAKSGDHAYTIKDNWKSDREFNEVVQYIRDFGVKRWFYGREYTYLDIDQYQYFSMGAPVKDTILINRAKIQSNLFTQ